MSSVATSSLTRSGSSNLERQREGMLPRQNEHGQHSMGLWVTGLTIAGLGLLAWYKFGSDFKRYLKIERM
jgi:hypothetical protein